MKGDTGPFSSPAWDQAAIRWDLLRRLRATSAAAAAPNSSATGGAGTGDGLPLDPPTPPDELELDDELDELELDDDPPNPPVLLVLDEPLELNPPVDDEYPLEEEEKPSLDDA